MGDKQQRYDRTYLRMARECELDNGETKWEVIHGEANAILKCARNGQSCDGATIYQTHSPCKDCSRLILQSGIKRLVYIEEYKDIVGLEFLRNAGIEITKYENID
jgi:dCMP deaminase